jgi:hypothetical protein
MDAWTHVRMCACAYACTCMNACCACVHMHAARVYGCMYPCMHVCVRMCTCMHVCACAYTVFVGREKERHRQLVFLFLCQQVNETERPTKKHEQTQEQQQEENAAESKTEEAGRGRRSGGGRNSLCAPDRWFCWRTRTRRCAITWFLSRFRILLHRSGPPFSRASPNRRLIPLLTRYFAPPTRISLLPLSFPRD